LREFSLIEFVLTREIRIKKISERGGITHSGEKAAEGRRSPRRWREFQWHTNFAERPGVRQSSGALDERFPTQLWLDKFLAEEQSRKRET
jgi:hypothetical protein